MGCKEKYLEIGGRGMMKLGVRKELQARRKCGEKNKERTEDRNGWREKSLKEAICENT